MWRHQEPNKRTTLAVWTCAVGISKLHPVYDRLEQSIKGLMTQQRESCKTLGAALLTGTASGDSVRLDRCWASLWASWALLGRASNDP